MNENEDEFDDIHGMTSRSSIKFMRHKYQQTTPSIEASLRAGLTLDARTLSSGQHEKTPISMPKNEKDKFGWF